jgi:hypothetical protein
MKYQHFILGGVLGVFGLIVILWLTNLSGGPSDDEVYRGKAAPFRSDELVRLVMQGGPEAAKEFNGKGLEITGEVLVLEKPAIVMEEGAIWCFFPEKSWAKIQKQVRAGDMVTVRGLCAGLDPSRRTPTLVVKGCDLVEHIENPHGGMPHP